jgi:hypothetical protein
VSSTPSPAEIRAVERVAHDLRVAPETEELDGSIPRAANGLTGRANSVWPDGDRALPLAERLDRAEARRWSRDDPVSPGRARRRDAASSVAPVGRAVAAGGWLGLAYRYLAP